MGSMEIKMKKFYIISLLITVAIAFFLSPLASSAPDGLEKAGEKLGFVKQIIHVQQVKAPLSDYQLPGMKHKIISTSLAGAMGTLFIFLLVLGISTLILKIKRLKVDKK